MSRNKMVAFAALTQVDLDTFAKDLKRVFPISDDPLFAELIRAIDQADRQRWHEGDRREALARLRSG